MTDRENREQQEEVEQDLEYVQQRYDELIGIVEELLRQIEEAERREDIDTTEAYKFLEG